MSKPPRPPKSHSHSRMRLRKTPAVRTCYCTVASRPQLLWSSALPGTSFSRLVKAVRTGTSRLRATVRATGRRKSEDEPYQVQLLYLRFRDYFERCDMLNN